MYCFPVDCTLILWSRRKVINSLKSNVFDIVVSMKVQPQVFVTRTDYRRKLATTKFTENIRETVFAISHLWPPSKKPVKTNKQKTHTISKLLTVASRRNAEWHHVRTDHVETTYL